MSTYVAEEFIVNPATGRRLCPVKKHGPEFVAAALSEAQEAQHRWAEVSVRERIEVIRCMERLLVDRAEEVAALISECTGKTRIDALATDVVASVIATHYYSRVSRSFLSPKRLRHSTPLFFNKRSVLLREPYGVVAIISPWNYPFGIPMHHVVTALLCGNAVLLKVATQVQPVGDLIGELALQAGLPTGLLTVLHVPGREAGELLCRNGIGKIFFTGSTEAGRTIMNLAAQRLLPVCLELGGNDAMIVLEDADPQRAAAGAMWAGMSTTGQSCAAVERIFVLDGIYESFVGELKHRLSRLKVGDPAELGTDVGSMANAKQLSSVRRHIDDAVGKGARLWQVPEAGADGQTGDTTWSSGGLYFQPTILEDATDDMLVMSEEIFGPVLAVTRVSDVEEAVFRANRSSMGLSASVWSRSRSRAREVARRLEAGSIMINDHLMAHALAETPWGGRKDSSIGWCHGIQGFEEMTQPKVIVDDLLHRAAGNFWWHPYSVKVYEALFGAMQMLFAASLFRRISGALKLVPVYLHSFRHRQSRV